MTKGRRSARNSHDLTRVLLNRNGDVPNFALLLGAGASTTSGVKAAESMIEDWRDSLYVASHSSKPISEWLNEQPWFQDDDEYSLLFEHAYDHPSQRRVFIEECLKRAHPGWGYVYLTSLLAHKVFNVVLTTNFDDLINEACYLYSENLRPMVAAHDSSIAAMRMSSDRPKIIKLHGDFLYDNIKNTLTELETLEANTKSKLSQIALESGLVVVGYGGRDRSIMDVIEMLLRSDHYFPHGVYWCVRKPYQVNKRLESLLKRDRIHLVEIEGFDELMTSVHGSAAFALPEPLSAPLKVARDRARLFVNIPADLKSHPVIGRDIACVLREMDKADVAHNIPPMIQAAIAENRGDLDAAIRLWRAEAQEHPSDTQVVWELAEALIKKGELDEAATVVSRAPDSWSNKTYLLLRARAFDRVVQVATDRLGRAPSDWIARINRAIAYKRLGRLDEMRLDLTALEPLTADPESGWILTAGIASLAEDRTRLVFALPNAIAQGQLTKENFELFPVFDDVRADQEITRIIARALKEKAQALAERKGHTSANSASLELPPKTIEAEYVVESLPKDVVAQS